MKVLSGAERDDLAQCLVAAFSLVDLSRLARRVFDLSLEDITSHSNKVEVSNELVEFARQKDRMQELIVAARLLNDSNNMLKAFAERVEVEGNSLDRPIPPPRTAQSKLTNDELDHVRAIICDNLVTAFNEDHLIQFMTSAGLSSNLIGNFDWADKDPTNIAAQLVNLALRQGRPLVRTRPGNNTVLGLILDELLRRELVGLDDGQFLATLIQRYNLLDLNQAEVSPGLLALLQITPVAATPAATLELERVVRQSDPFLDVGKWFSDSIRAAQTMCRILVPQAGGALSYGTGVLVSPDLVLTTFYVVADLINDKKSDRVPVDPRVVKVQFGYIPNATSQEVQQGQIYGLAAGDAWLVDSSPFDQLDYALIQLDSAAGTDQVGDRPRGWLTPRPHTFTKGEPLVIIQHLPPGPDPQEVAPLKIVLGSNAVIAASSDGSRVTYTGNTESGSGGAPCFNINWEWIAMHHVRMVDYREGVPVATIAQQPVIKAALAANPAQP